MNPAFVGNDVIDLQDPRVADKLLDDRFLERVLDPRERMDVAAADHPHVALWRCWAAKEAVYKVVSKLRGEPPVFAHRSFVLLDGHVEYEGARYEVRFESSERVLHGLACAGAVPGAVAAEHHLLDEAGSPWDASLEDLLSRLTAREADAVHSRHSAAVRIGARGTLASALGVEARRIEIVCAPGVTGRRPPRVLLDGSPAPADVSLSHHGEWIAWALLLR